MGRARTTGRPRWRRTTTRPSGCSASSPTTRTTPPTTCCASTRARSASRTRTPRRASACSSTAEPGETVPDPYFGGAGPDRTGCMRCGRCMIGCPHGAKNTLVKNYLWLAERAGAEVLPERMVVDVRPLGAPDGSEGYEVTTERPGAWLRGAAAHVHRARRRVRRRRRSAPTGCSPRASSHGSLPRALRPPRRAGAHQLRGDPRRHAAARRAGHHAPGRDHRLDLPRPGHAHRDRRLRRRGRLDELALHGAGRRRHARDAAAEAAARAAARHPLTFLQAARPARLVAPHDHRARDADARQRDRAARHAHAGAACGCRPSRTPSGRSRRTSRSPTSSPQWLARRTGGIAQSSR